MKERFRNIFFRFRTIAITVIALLFSSITTNAQTLKGIVVDSRTNEPIIGAVVSVKTSNGLSGGASTDVSGRFSLALKSVPTTIVASYTGYNNEEISIYEVTDDEIQIDLTENFNALQGVVVVGYGVQKKSSVSGAVSSINVSELNRDINASINNLLDGTTPGLQVVPTSGQPGGGISLRVRGSSSVQGGNEPLYVIDGFPIYNERIVSGVFDNTVGPRPQPETVDPLSSINPGDIESITVLKDASATAIYGSRGANGVILITTKHGKKSEKTQVAYDGSIGWQTLRNKFDVLNATEFAELRNEALFDQNPGNGRFQYMSQEEINRLGDGIDWQDAAYQTALVTNHQLSLSGGTEKNRYAISGNYYSQDGILKNTGFERLSAIVNIDSKISDKLSTGLNLAASKLKSKIPPTGVVYSILQAPSTATIYDQNGSYTYQNSFELNHSNPIASLLEQTNKSRNYSLIGSVFGEYEFVKDLKLRILLGANVSAEKDYRNIPSFLYEGASDKGKATLGQIDLSSWVNENTLSYHTTINKYHNLDFLLGFTQQESKQEIFRASSSNYVSDALSYNSLQSGSVTNTSFSYGSSNSLLSILGRINYNYDDRHSLSLSLRRDGSSRFGKDRKWGTFTSVGYSWNISNESFFKSLKENISNFKLRLSYGKTGNQEIGNYQSLSTLSSDIYFFNNTKVVGFSPDRIANYDLGWETTKQVDLGIELGFFKDRLNFTVDYYQKNTTDLLLNVSIPYTSGYDTSLQNYGSIRNEGFEFGFNAKPFVGKFKWDISGNISTNRNKVTSLGDGSSSAYIYAYSTVSYYILEVGKPIGSYYGAIYDGVLQKGEETTRGKFTYNQTATPGDKVYKDINGDGKFTNSEDRTIIGDAQPDFTFGLNNTFSYKNLDLSFFINGSFGNDIVNVNKEYLSFFSGLMNAAGFARERWTESNPSTTVSRAKLDPAALYSSEFVEDGSYVRLKNITFGYKLPKGITRNIGVSSIRLYISATNLLTITRYTGYDPEVSSTINALTAGTDYGAYPSAKTFNFGINVKF